MKTLVLIMKVCSDCGTYSNNLVCSNLNPGLLARANKLQKKLKRQPKLTVQSDDSILVKNGTLNGLFITNTIGGSL